MFRRRGSAGECKDVSPSWVSLVRFAVAGIQTHQKRFAVVGVASRFAVVGFPAPGGSAPKRFAVAGFRAENPSGRNV